MSEWTDQLAGARMQVDKQFRDRVLESNFSNQEWGLVMTAVDWEVNDAADPEAAELVADTSRLPDIVPELERISQQMGSVGAGGGGRGRGQSRGLLGRLRGFVSSLTGGGGGSEARLREAETLVEDYADALQEHLEKQGRWGDIRSAAADG